MTAKTVARLKKILTPPVFADEEKTRVARLFNIIFLVAIVVILIYSFIVPFLYDGVTQLVVLTIIFLHITLALLGLFLIRRGRIRFTALLLTTSFWLSVTVAAYLAGGVNNTLFSAYILAILFAGIILGKRAIILFTSLVFLTAAALFYAEANSLLPPVTLPHNLAADWMSQNVQIILIALLLYLSTGSLQDALARARANEQAMVEINDALQQEIVKRVQAEVAQERYARHLETLQSVTAALSTSLALDELLHIILEQLAVVLPFDSATIFLLEQDSLLAMAGRGLPQPERVIGHSFSIDNDLCRLMLQTKESVWLTDAQADSRFERWGDANYIHGWLSVPLLAHGELIGCMSVDSRQTGAYGPEQAALVMPFADQAAQAIENARLHEQARRHAAELEARVAERTRELREAQEQLLRREKLAVMGQLAGGIAHELRNPLGAIKNAAYALNLLQEKKNPEVAEMLHVLRVEVDTAERIIRTLLDYARSRPPHCELVAVNEIMQAVLADTAVPPHIHIITQLDNTLPPVPADPGQLTQIFTNIIQNSIQAMSDPPLPEKKHQLTIKTAKANPGWITISFADTGGGIPVGNLGKLFEPLFTTKARGIGLGLALVKTFVEGHGGNIAVVSQEGEGAFFTIRLPLAFPTSERGG